MALSWDDVDLTMGTVKICRNITLEGEFKVPKTASGERIINLLQPALDALIRQRELTYMFRPLKIQVRQRDTSTFENQTIRPVFSPKIMQLAPTLETTISTRPFMRNGAGSFDGQAFYIAALIKRDIPAHVGC